MWYNITEYAGNIQNRYSRTDTMRRVFNTIGYNTDNAYYHYIKDHLGNIRETYIKPAPNTKYFIQNMQYYPSGIPWKTSTGAIEHPYRYNGKELILMHGQDEYDNYYGMLCNSVERIIRH